MAAQYFAKAYGRVYGTGAGGGGPSVAARLYRFTTPSTTWIIIHNLGTYNFSVSLMDSDNQQVYAGIKAVSENQIIIYFTEPITGIANVIFYL
jgi:hypothetical protein